MTPLRTAFLTLAALACATPAALGTPIVALHDDQATNDSRPESVTARADMMAATGTKMARLNVEWHRIATRRPIDPTNPDDPAYDWSSIDGPIQAYRDRGIVVITVVFGTPGWASAKHTFNATPKAADFGAFNGALARRYSGSWPKPGGGFYPRIRSISPGNEPNLNFWITPQCKRIRGKWTPVSPLAYAAMLKAAYTQIKAAAPDMLVVAGETLAGESNKCTSATSTVGTIDFTRALHKALGGKRKVPFDAWAVHIHVVGPPDRVPFFPSWKTLPKVTVEVNKMHPKGRMPILVTETSYTTSYSAYHRYFVTEAQQAEWVRLTYTLAARQPQLEAVVWFNLQDNFDWPAGLVRGDGTLKPSFATFQSLAATSVVPAKWAVP